MSEFALQPPPDRPQKAFPKFAGCSARAGRFRSPGRAHPFAPSPGACVGNLNRSGRGADAGIGSESFHNPSYANGTKREQPCARRIIPLLPIELALVAVAKTGGCEQNGSLAGDEAQIIDMQGKLSANHGCPPQVGAMVDTEPAPTSRAHGRHRRAAPGAPAPRASPDRRGAAPSSGACGGAVGLGLDFGSRRDRAGCRPRMGAPTRGGHGNLIYNYFGGSP
jgi:hypothetical protein